jgi:hypothetical protein
MLDTRQQHHTATCRHQKVLTIATGRLQ